MMYPHRPHLYVCHRSFFVAILSVAQLLLTNPFIMSHILLS